MILSYADINDQKKKKYMKRELMRMGRLEREKHRFILCNQVLCVCFTPL